MEAIRVRQWTIVSKDLTVSFNSRYWHNSAAKGDDPIWEDSSWSPDSRLLITSAKIAKIKKLKNDSSSEKSLLISVFLIENKVIARHSHWKLIHFRSIFHLDNPSNPTDHNHRFPFISSLYSRKERGEFHDSPYFLNKQLWSFRELEKGKELWSSRFHTLLRGIMGATCTARISHVSPATI